MSIVKPPQHQFGQVDIAGIPINARSRDDIPALLKGLQYLYIHEETRHKVFALLEDALGSQTNNEVGRPGMELWKVFVLATHYARGVIRLWWRPMCIIPQTRIYCGMR